MEGGKAKRTWKIVEIRKPAQHNKSGTAKKTASSDDSYLHSSTPAGAASKAFHAACRSKKIKGQCTFIVTVRESTQGSLGKQFSYECKRVKLAKPLELPGRTIEYDMKIKAIKK